MTVLQQQQLVAALAQQLALALAQQLALAPVQLLQLLLLLLNKEKPTNYIYEGS